MRKQNGWLVGALLVSAFALWLLLAGPERILGFDSGQAGMVLLMATAWLSLYRISKTPRDQLEGMASPGEWRAWLGLGFMLMAVVYFLVKAQVFQQMSAWNDPRAAAVARNLVMLLIAWAVLSNVLGSRWKGAVQEDERDREIEKQAAGWGRGALVFCIVGIVAMLGFSPTEKLQWAKPFVIANLLVFALMWGWLCEYAATVAMYRRDSR
ncbi:hypothetical protein [Pseudoxanthomonas sacheonensis]|uniref:Magnesium-transporting ATPase (P-type) n=1 Tax=Pseudoxanthomonas sacheonensis TaxID=443615 RepID=A0ABU1RN07_9GAMM|nr:hypothetical protein [Pseudoxanthomonas sacheonensis]MDR6840157.1 magnesium-transporting ATPase (P-type) [Pseudoxanthomonas sacheonensis]